MVVIFTEKEAFGMTSAQKKEKALYLEAVDTGAISVSANGAMRLDLGKFLDLKEGRDKLLKIAQETKTPQE